MADWLTQPGPARDFYNEIGNPYDAVKDHYRDKLAPGAKTIGNVVELGGEPVGYIQRYWVSDYPEHERAVGARAGSAGVDLFIGSPERLGLGLGSRMLCAYLAEFIFGEMGAECCVADPSADNLRSLRMFEKCGFQREFCSESPDGRQTVVVVLERERFLCS